MNTLQELQNKISSEKRSNANTFAVFDFDQTVIVNDIAEVVLKYLCRNKLLRDQTLLAGAEKLADDFHESVFRRYYQLANEHSHKTRDMLAAQALSGFSANEITDLATRAIQQEGREIKPENVFGVMVTHGLTVERNILDLMDWLQKHQVSIWIVSASPQVLVEAATAYFAVPGRIIGLRNKTDGHVFLKDLEEPLSIGVGKVDCIKTFISPDKKPVLAAGDSINDLPMLEYSQNPLVVDRKNQLAEIAQTRGWTLV